ncbi:MGH1-like glycoside hydrolase domain-containing protein [Streptosporangium sp. DT93]|uniref:MGH1-like glycoside hydrolase domain-containing protein n=1 Tax=Streptosporangium sp. DT93 TaxID=3393428 RepID=UPI003CF14B04
MEGSYVYANARAAAQAYELIGDGAKAAEMRGVADRVRDAVLTMWDADARVFKHRDLQTGTLIPWKESNNYIPFSTGLVPAGDPKYREALRLWADPAEYPIFPVYTANQKDKAEAAAAGKPGRTTSPRSTRPGTSRCSPRRCASTPRRTSPPSGTSSC